MHSCGAEHTEEEYKKSQTCASCGAPLGKITEMILRGYDVVEHESGRWTISKDGTVVSEQPTPSAGRRWIADQKMKEYYAQRERKP